MEPIRVSGAQPGASPTAAGQEGRERFIAIGEIAAEIAHELRNALQIISANVYLAKQMTGPESATVPFLSKIEKSARLAHGIVDDLMALARGEPAHAEPVLLAEVLVAARTDLPEPGASFEDRLAAPDLRIRAHVGLLSRLFHALYENSIKATAGGQAGQVVIETRARVEGDRVVIEVADNGPGVPAEIADALFEPLVSRSPGGTGLGLALARRVAAAHSGSIALVPSEAGATFRVELPAA